MLIRQQVDNDRMQFGFMPGCGTANTAFTLRRLKEKYLAKRKTCTLHLKKALEKAFDGLCKDVVWWALRKLDIEQWLFKIVFIY